MRINCDECGGEMITHRPSLVEEIKKCIDNLDTSEYTRSSHIIHGQYERLFIHAKDRRMIIIRGTSGEKEVSWGLDEEGREAVRITDYEFRLIKKLVDDKEKEKKMNAETTDEEAEKEISDAMKTDFDGELNQDDCDMLLNSKTETDEDIVELLSGDAINPEHYKSHGIEAKHITTFLDNPRGNAIKYVWRCYEKGKFTQDLNKAIWYLKEIESIGFMRLATVSVNREKKLKESIYKETTGFKAWQTLAIIYILENEYYLAINVIKEGLNEQN